MVLRGFLFLQLQGFEGDPLRVRPGGAQGLQGGQASQVRRDGRPPDRPQELRSPEGQAFLRHRQVRLRATLAVCSGPGI